MNKRTTKTKSELVVAAAGGERPERLSLAENRDRLFNRFYNNVRILVATQDLSMVDLSRKLGMKSGARISDLCYGRGVPSTEELIVLSKHFDCSLDDLLYKTIVISWQDDHAIP